MLELIRKYRTVCLMACLVLAALLLYSFHLRHRDHTTLFERMVLQVTGPFQNGIQAVVHGSADLWGHYLWLVSAQKENERLTAENHRLRSELSRLEEIRLANERLRLLLDFRQTVDLPALPAQVIGEDASSWFRTVVIDKGLEDGVLEGMPVVVAEGVVGRTIRVGAHQARVLLVTDASSAIAALVQKNRTRGVCRGRGDVLTFDFALRQKDVGLGDRIVTSGIGGVFPKGLVIGEVSRVAREDYGLFQAVTVTPVVDFSRLEEVLVLLKDET